MKVTVYDLLGIVKDNKKDIYVKYINKTNEKEEIMWACIENIIDKLDKKLIELKDKVEILEEKPKKIEELKIEQIENNPSCYYIKNEYGTKCCLTKHSKIIAEKVNELQKAVNYLLEKESDK